MKDSRRGSALLIVLGMLSFMVVSAVGFSIYMRQGRLPSSYLRRNVASRYLVKAALANAIEDLDAGFMTRYEIGEENSISDNGRVFGILDDPYPGIVSGGSEDNRMQTGRRKYRDTQGGTYSVTYSENGNYWFHRVFCPFGTLPYPETETRARLEPPLTVPTLTLEALAYLPPAIIDDVRKVSRLTRTAQWRPFPYDAGRYAYTVVNVSDLFDVNRLQADVARDSGPNRITLTSLCARSESNPTDIDDGSIDELQTILDELETKKVNGNETPFTSLADFNLVAAGQSKFGYAPFMDYIGNSGGNMLDQGDAQTANALFITDTWFPTTNSVSGTTVYDLEAGDQPFNQYTVVNNFLDVTDNLNSRYGADNQNLFVKNLGIGVCALYDYLDGDNIPISLCLPTTEAVPMVVGVGAPIGLQPTFGNVGDSIEKQVSGLHGKVTDGEGETKQVTDITITRTLQQMGINSFGGNAHVQVLLTYPFKRMKTANRVRNFKLRGLLRVYVAPSGMKSRVTDPNSVLQPRKTDWDNSNPVAKNGVATFRSQDLTVSAFKNDIAKTDEAIDDSLTLRFDLGNLTMPLYWEVKEENPNSPSGSPAIPDTDNYKASYKSLGNFNNETTALRPLAVDGGENADWVQAANGRFEVAQAYPNVSEFDPGSTLSGSYRIYAAVWVQVLDSDNSDQVVDMAPASIVDDNELLQKSVPDTGITQRILGDGAPTLNFMNSTEFKYETVATTLGQSLDDTWEWKSLYAVDPRFNYAPEDWFAKKTVGPTKSDWMTELGLSGSSSQLLGQDGRDRDIFMFVSDQEYLQSIGELQFLPAIADMDGNATFPTGDLPDLNASRGDTSQEPFSERVGYAANKDRFMHRDFFWRTYTAYQNESGVDPTRNNFYLNPYRMKNSGGEYVTINSGSGTFKLNPFSEDDRVMSAAVIGTPFDYYVASTNNNQLQPHAYKNTLATTITPDQMLKTYSFGQSSVAEMSNKEMLNAVDALREALTSQTTFDLNAAFSHPDDGPEWQRTVASDINDNNKHFLGDTISQPLHGVDRKYLYSFWRECFDNRQQLFLIFVRAEPTSIGGGASGALTSAQLGGRAVALVWRDPTVPTQGTRMKRTQISDRDDYRQFKKDAAPHRTRVLFFHQFD